MADDPPTRSLPPDHAPAAAPPADPPTADPHATAAFPLQSETEPAAGVTGYEILGELGRGGMGVVYHARDVELHREVALKMIRAGDPADPRAVIRFLAEAEAVAAIRHPHVVQVFEFGESHSRPYFVMEYLSGGTLAQRLRTRSHSPVDAALLVAKLARAVQAAHDLQIIHRDMKPGNVLFDAAGEPKVTDFGLAKRGGGADLTRTQAVMGTPAYMAPEQAEGKGKFVGPAADTYALGVILYECLTGTVPFADDDLMAMLRRVVDEQPEPPRKRKPELPRDLDLICLKCLTKEPAERYATAGKLADELGRFTRGEPVSVRAAGVLERGYKWTRRNPSRAAAVAFGGVAAVFAAVGIALALAWSEAAEERRKADDANHSLIDAKEEVEDALAKKQEALRDVQQKHDKVGQLLVEQDKLNATLKSLNDELRKSQQDLVHKSYFRTVNLAHRAVLDGDGRRAAELLDQCPEEFRGWEWNHARRKLNASQMELKHTSTLPFQPAVRLSRVGPWLAVGGSDVRVWDLRTGLLVAKGSGLTSTLRFTSDGRLRVPTQGTSWDPSTGSWDEHPLLPRNLEWLEISPDGRWTIATTIKHDHFLIVETATGNTVLTLKPEKLDYMPFVDPAFSPDGTRVAVCTGYTKAEVWDIPAGKQIAAIVLPENTGGSLRAMAFRPGGRDLLTTSNDGMVRVWEVETGKPRHNLSQTRGFRVSAAYSRDGRQIAVWWPTEVQLHDADTGKWLWGWPQSEEVENVAISPDGTRLAVSGGRAIRVLDAANGQTLQELFGHAGKVKQVAYAADGRLVSLGEDGSPRVWDGHAGETFVPLPGWYSGRNSIMAVDPPGNRVAILGYIPWDQSRPNQSEDGATVWDLAGRKVVAVVRGPFSDAAWAAFTPDGRHLLRGTTTGRISAWDLATGQQVPSRYWVICGRLTAVHPGRQLLAVADVDEKRVTLWDVSRVPERLVTGQRRFLPEQCSKELPPEQCPVLRGTFPIDGRVAAFAFSPDGRHLAAVPVGESGKLWEVDTGRAWELPRAAPLDLPRYPFVTTAPLALGPGGNRTVWPVRGELKVADARTGLEAITLSRRGKSLQTAAFSADGTKLYALTEGGVLIFESGPRPPFVPHVFDAAPPPREAGPR